MPVAPPKTWPRIRISNFQWFPSRGHVCLFRARGTTDILVCLFPRHEVGQTFFSVFSAPREVGQTFLSVFSAPEVGQTFLSVFFRARGRTDILVCLFRATRGRTDILVCLFPRPR